MTLKIQLGPELYNHIRTLVHDELSEQKKRRKIEQLGMKIRSQLDELSGPNRPASGLKVNVRTVLTD